MRAEAGPRPSRGVTCFWPADCISAPALGRRPWSPQLEPEFEDAPAVGGPEAGRLVRAPLDGFRHGRDADPGRWREDSQPMPSRACDGQELLPTFGTHHRAAGTRRSADSRSSRRMRIGRRPHW